MKMNSNRQFGAGFAAGIVLFAGLAASMEANSSGGLTLFTGGATAPTPEAAVQDAIADAEAAASAEGLYTCELVGQPTVFPQRITIKGPAFSAEATLGCS